ncbi:multicopper oxidase domain-containing protein [Mycobacterium asiaticum]|uniref:Copper-containing nitrite reductase n=1 Tax=Mycobacterium asiaticum TaxID=1790 RepID=A0A1A3MP42_MYCAS|nr:multicopper oxidase domain-containing protein [Mycobacterium asiaticum]OBK11713.1 copper oxidase [Mycobacterium asiaticum]
MNRSGWHLRVGTVVFAWLAALVSVAVAHRYIPFSGWLLVHLLALGAAGNAILIWSRHFADALLRRPPDSARTAEVLRIAAFNAGAVAVVTGMLGRWWPAVLAGGVVVAVVALAHGATLLQQMRTALPARFGVTIRYYIAATWCLAVGAGLGVAMANSALPGRIQERFVIAHAAVNLFGWVGLTVLGTLVTLWPTMLRTRMATGVEAAARHGLPALLTALVVTAGGAVVGSPPITGLGALGYLGAAGIVLRPHLDEIRRKQPNDFATLSVLAGVAWLIGSLAFAAIALTIAPTWPAVVTAAGKLTAPVLAGFLVQVLLGSLTYLAPVVMGGRAATLAAGAELERGAAWRVTVANAGLLLCVLPTPSLVRVAASVLVLLSYATFLPLLVRAAWRVHRDRDKPTAPGQPAAAPPGRRLGVAAAGLGVVVLATAAGVAADPASLGIGTSPRVAVAATGHTTTASVRIEGMRFVPDTVEVPAGNRLRITLANTGTDQHDLVLSNGSRTGRIAPGESAVLEAGVIGSSLDGWCAVAGHRQMGMTFKVRATGTPMPTTDSVHSGHQGPAAGATIPAGDIARSLGAAPAPGFTARDAALAPAAAEHRLTLPVTEIRREVSPGITQRLWTFGGTAPGPTLRGKVGDVFEITLVNDGSTGHSIDFHAGALAPDEPMRTIQPGQHLVYRFTATRAGIWLYHCSTMPMSLHIANGMFGAVIIDPPDLPRVDREYLIVQSEMYLGVPGGEADADKVAADRPDLVLFNGYARQYDHAPLTARVGERVRIWVLAAGPNRGTSFHVVGGQFDTVWSEGDYRLGGKAGRGAGGAQTLGLFAAQGGFAELTFGQAGRYPFVSHAMVDAERGAHGIIEVARR